MCSTPAFAKIKGAKGELSLLGLISSDYITTLSKGLVLSVYLVDKEPFSIFSNPKARTQSYYLLKISL